MFPLDQMRVMQELAWSHFEFYSVKYRHTNNLGIALKYSKGKKGGRKMLIIVEAGCLVHEGSLYHSLYFGNACKHP